MGQLTERCKLTKNGWGNPKHSVDGKLAYLLRVQAANGTKSNSRIAIALTIAACKMMFEEFAQIRLSVMQSAALPAPIAWLII